LFLNNETNSSYSFVTFVFSIAFCGKYSSKKKSTVQQNFHQMPSNYEIILDRMETVLGDDDKMLDLGTLRVKKFNRTAFVKFIAVQKVHGCQLDVFYEAAAWQP
jgi:hypothetical protein